MGDGDISCVVGGEGGGGCVVVRVCVLSLPPSPSLLFIYFVISDSSDMANTQLRPITVYRLLMSSHFDKLLNLK